jgi:hypothetical protein
MDEDEAGQQDAHELPGGHDGGEHERAEVFNGVKDEELCDGCTDGQDGYVSHNRRMSDDELDRIEQLSGEPTNKKAYDS